ncbi:MAG: D-2-hydroxyacid dehydrogenase [Halobacteriaceae archaeon]
MDDGPKTLVLHTVRGSHWWGDGEDLVAALREVAPDATVEHARTPPASRTAIADAEVVVSAYLPRELLARADALRWVQALSAGVDFYPLDELEERGVALTTAAGIHAEAIGEQVLGYLLTFERNIHRGIQNQQRGVWERYEGGELRGKTLGVVGVGAIGTRVAELGSALGMTVVGTKRDVQDAPDAVDEMLPPDGLYDLLERSHYVVVSCPLTEETHHLLSTEELATMRDDAVLVNVARGPIVDEDALARVLQQRAIRGAALDVFESEPLDADSPLWDLSNAVLTPHMAGSTPEKVSRVVDIFARNYEAYVAGDRSAMVNRVR